MSINRNGPQHKGVRHNIEERAKEHWDHAAAERDSWIQHARQHEKLQEDYRAVMAKNRRLRLRIKELEKGRDD